MAGKDEEAVVARPHAGTGTRTSCPCLRQGETTPKRRMTIEGRGSSRGSGAERGSIGIGLALQRTYVMVMEEVEEGEGLVAPDLGRKRRPKEEEAEPDPGAGTPIETWSAQPGGPDERRRRREEEEETEEETEGRTGRRGTTTTGRRGMSTSGGTGKWGAYRERSPEEED